MNTANISVSDIDSWLTNAVASILNIQSEEVDKNIPFERYGLESADIVGMTADLEDWLQCSLDDPTLMYEYPTIKELTTYLANNYAV